MKLALALLLVITACVYASSLYAPFVFDDDHFVYKNPSVTFHTPISLTSARPVTLTTYRLNYLFGGVDPFGYHVVNLAIHLINGLLVFWLARLVIMDDTAALFAAGLFLLHPIQSEAVIYISGRTELLAVMFGVSAMTAYLRNWKLAAGLLFVFAVASKEYALVLLGIIALYEVIQCRVPLRGVIVSASALLASGYVLIHTYTAFEPAERSWFAHLVIQCGQIGQYLAMMVWPTGFTIDHDAEALPLVLGYAVIAALIAASVIAWQYRSVRPIEAFGWFWFMIALTPRFALNIPEFVSEHHFYLGMVGLCLLISPLFKGVSACRTYSIPSPVNG